MKTIFCTFVFFSLSLIPIGCKSVKLKLNTQNSLALGSCLASNELLCINYLSMPSGNSEDARASCEAGGAGTYFDNEPCPVENVITTCQTSFEGFEQLNVFYTGASPTLIQFGCNQ